MGIDLANDPGGTRACVHSWYGLSDAQLCPGFFSLALMNGAKGGHGFYCSRGCKCQWVQQPGPRYLHGSSGPLLCVLVLLQVTTAGLPPVVAGSCQPTQTRTDGQWSPFPWGALWSPVVSVATVINISVNTRAGLLWRGLCVVLGCVCVCVFIFVCTTALNICGWAKFQLQR